MNFSKREAQEQVESTLEKYMLEALRDLGALVLKAKLKLNSLYKSSDFRGVFPMHGNIFLCFKVHR